jgi:hypothetical protein
VFIPNIEQKVQDNKAELARMEAELKGLELSALQSKDDQKKQEVERQKRAIEARIKAEELKKKQLAEERLRIQQEEQKRAALEARNREDEAKLAKIKTELERKKQLQPVIKTNSIEAAVAEIKRINEQITELDNNAAPAREQIITRYDKKIAELNAQQRDEFEKERDFRARIQKESELLESRKQNELTQLAVESTALREELKRISAKEYTLDASQVEIELGKYDVEKERFPVVLRNKPTSSVVVVMNGSIPLPVLQAKAFKQQFESGLIRPQIRAWLNGRIITATLLNDAENYLLEFDNGKFITVAERKRIEMDRDFARLFIIDRSSSLMWTRGSNVAGKKMDWDQAKVWVKNLNYGGYSDWRLPTQNELVAFSKRHGNLPNAFYWTSSTDNYGPIHVHLSDSTYNGYYKTTNNYVWPVRNTK